LSDWFWLKICRGQLALSFTLIGTASLRVGEENDRPGAGDSNVSNRFDTFRRWPGHPLPESGTVDLQKLTAAAKSAADPAMSATHCPWWLW